MNRTKPQSKARSRRHWGKRACGMACAAILTVLLGEGAQAEETSAYKPVRVAGG